MAGHRCQGVRVGPALCGLDRPYSEANGHGRQDHLGKISKKREAYLRRLLVLGATAVVRYARNWPEIATWINGLLARLPPGVAIVALANKLARIAWAVMAGSENYRGGAVMI